MLTVENLGKKKKTENFPLNLQSHHQETTRVHTPTWGAPF